jgi:hypothetical protein
MAKGQKKIQNGKKKFSFAIMGDNYSNTGHDAPIHKILLRHVIKSAFIRCFQPPCKEHKV